ncbi:alkaline phosphatase [Niallia sp. NCCP-28]|uniref:alkaline phosphatase n=1 Tax=Niallia sp. NCCP-28 TaxID=2934712 RepID=UPI00207E0737|nr:alkaline phosphatase [Niallia sp. NCCP-28]GKU81149.1 alkaline phosphatase [Niallia sp. NCCP-28]
MKKLTIYLSFLILLFIQTSPGTAAPKDGPKNIILLIGDGMGLGQMEIARLFEYGKKGHLYIETLPYTALAHTYSANNRVTDSAAGGTALAIGEKTKNEMIGVTANGKEKKSILDLFKNHLYKTGIVTTNSVTDATPASFTASVKNRWEDQHAIAKQQLQTKVDVIMGGGLSYFGANEKGDTNLINQYKKAGYQFVATKQELQHAKSDKILGLFGPKHLNFKLDRNKLHSQEPTLTEMTAKTIETLSKNSKGFFAMIEGARIDHASHASDLTSIWKETIEFDNTVKYCVEWAKKHPDTLIVVAADHETMGISSSEPMDIKALKQISVTPHYMASQLQKNKSGIGYTNQSIRKVFKQYAHMTLTNRDIALFQSDIKNDRNQVYPDQQIAWEIGNRIAKHYHAGSLDRSTEKLSTTGGHTSNMIAVFAYGKGANQFHGVMDNTDIPKILAELMGFAF